MPERRNDVDALPGSVQSVIRLHRMRHVHRLVAAVLLLGTAGWAGALGGEELPPPAVAVDADLYHISPATSEGINDATTLFPVVEIQQVGGVEKAYRLVISNEAGQAVRTIAGDDGTPVPGALDRFLIDLGLQERSSVAVPSAFVWDGRNDDGELVPDGYYLFVLEVTDDFGSTGVSEPRQLMVDNTAPTVTVVPEYLIFSPDGDGSRDSLTIAQSGSVEARWTGELLDRSGAVLRTFDWTDSAPVDFLWDGRDQAGRRLSDATFSYRISSTDPAGNTTVVTVDDIRIDTVAKRIGIDLETAAFSPNGDGVQDDMLFPVRIDAPESLVGWRAEVRDLQGQVVRTMVKLTPVPEPLRFDGRGDDGSVLREGSYTLLFSALYENGSTRVVESPPFELDVTSPQAFVALHYDVFSPNGDGVRDVVLVEQETTGEGPWLAVVTDARGREVRSEHLSDANGTFSWDGRDDFGSLVADGAFTYVLSARDAAGNDFSSKPLILTMDTRETPVALRVRGEHFSPNGDGIQDGIEIVPVLGVTDSIEVLLLEIVDAAGHIVHRDQRKEALGAFEWSGLASDGEPFADGEYSVRMSVSYANGNSGDAEAGPIVLDTRFPNIQAVASDLVFSPDGDGSKDELVIEQESTAEERWDARFLNAVGTAVVTARWQGEVTDYRWDGTDDQGAAVPDGEYRYEVTATDAAGNSVTARLAGIQIDRRATDARIGIADANRVGDIAGFSPNADGERDELIFALSTTTGVAVETWHLTVLGPGGEPTRIFRGGPDLLREQRWDGRTTAGEMAADGEYGAVFTVIYRKGDVAVDRLAERVILDTVYPAFDVEADYLLFSPDGDGRRDQLTVRHRTEIEHEWHTELAAADGTIIRERTVNDGVLADLIWDGTDESGNPVPDGEYRYRVRGSDFAGNVAMVELPPIVVDRRLGSAWMDVSGTGFSPNDDGVDDELVFELRVTRGVELDSWELVIADLDGNPVRGYSGLSSTGFPLAIGWDGGDDRGRRVADGEYAATFRVAYTKGDVAEVLMEKLAVDTLPPAVTVGAPYLLFSPDGDGRRDTITFTHDATPGDRWDATITDDRDGSVVLRRAWEEAGPLPDLVWDGRTDADVAVPDGTYTYRIASVDAGGSSVSAILEGIRVDTVTTVAALTADADAFSPNGDGDRDTIGNLISATTAARIDRWALSIVNAAGTALRTFAGGRSGAPLPEMIVWDGLDDAGALAPDGFYRATLAIEYVKGNAIEAATDPYLLDASPPQAAIHTELDTPTLPFSPDDDGLNDQLTIFLDAQDDGGIASWTLRILDPRGDVFAEYGGNGAPFPLGWDGYSDASELVQAAVDYTLQLEVIDHIGNRAAAATVVPIDVLVLREGDRLRIRISSITFAPDTADYQRLGDPERERRNEQTLDRLAQILHRYDSYNILLEGHAVSVYWRDAERARREQEQTLLPLSAARAEAVRNALIQRGIAPSRMTTVGLGGSQPLVPHGDMRNRWKNRRVEFLLIRQ